MSEDVADGGLPVAVLGAGPVGLAAAAHLAERGIGFVVLEAGDEAGAAVRGWGQVRVFSPWRYNVDAAAGRLLEAAGWQGPDPDGLPTGHELVDEYLAPLAKLPQIAPFVRFGHRATGIGRVGVDRVRTRGRQDAPFLIRAESDGGVVQLRARAVIDATGTWHTPNVLGAGGLSALGEGGAAGFISSALPDVLGGEREAFAGRRVLVVGAGHSAANTLLALAQLAEQEPGTTVAWALAPLIDPNEHSCGTVPPHGEAELAHPEPGYYLVGMKSYGRAPTFLMATGYEQVRSVAAFLAGDLAAAREVHLELPETGVCSSDPQDSTGSGCRDTSQAPVSRGLATGIAGGLLAAPLPLIEASISGGSGCC